MSTSNGCSASSLASSSAGAAGPAPGPNPEPAAVAVTPGASVSCVPPPPLLLLLLLPALGLPTSGPGLALAGPLTGCIMKCPGRLTPRRVRPRRRPTSMYTRLSVMGMPAGTAAVAQPVPRGQQAAAQARHGSRAIETRGGAAGDKAGGRSNSGLGVQPEQPRALTCPGSSS